ARRWIRRTRPAGAHRSRDFPTGSAAAAPAALPRGGRHRGNPGPAGRRFRGPSRARHRDLPRDPDDRGRGGWWQSRGGRGRVRRRRPDQRRASEEVKRDMERARPMDRLLVGDVGYGKTEVALRAAFKAVQAGKQVAVLVPTTILAEQHGRTFRERLADYPVRIEVLSR